MIIPGYSVIFKGTSYLIGLGRYEVGGRWSIRLVERDGSSSLSATTNLPDEPLALDEVFIKNWSGNAGMVEVLQAAGIIYSVAEFVDSGHVVVPKCTLSFDFTVAMTAAEATYMRNRMDEAGDLLRQILQVHNNGNVVGISDGWVEGAERWLREL